MQVTFDYRHTQHFQDFWGKIHSRSFFKKMSHFFVFFLHFFPYTKRLVKVEFVFDAFYPKRNFFCGHYWDSRVIVKPDLSVPLVELNFVTHSNIWWLQDTTRPNNGHTEIFLTCAAFFWIWKFLSGKMKLQRVTGLEEIFPPTIPISSNWWANTVASITRFFPLGTDGWNWALLIANLT